MKPDEARRLVKQFVPKNRNDKLALLATAVLLVSYLSTMSPWLEEEDSTHFALGLRGFDVTDNRPHPPGFPVYMTMASLLYWIIGDEVVSLTVLSALSGALCFLATYLFFRDIAGRQRALAAAILSALTPLFWLNSVKAMSDMAGLLFTTSALLLAYRRMTNGDRRYLYAACLLTGISAGVRIHSLLVLIPAISWVEISKRSDLAEMVKGALFLAAGIALWIVPLVAYTGLPEYVAASTGQLGYRVGNSAISIIGVDLTPILLLQKLYAFAYYFLLGGYGVNIWGLGILSAALLVLMLMLVALFFRSTSMMNRRSLFVGSSLAIYLSSIFVMLPALNPRYLLILVPLISLAAVVALWRVEARKRYSLLVLLAFLLAFHSVYLVSQMRSVPPPLLQVAQQLNAGHEEGDVLITGRFAASYFGYYPIKQIILDSETAGCNEIAGLLAEGRHVFSTIPLDDCSTLSSSRITEFTRDQRVHLKRSVMELYEILAVNS